eukprot:7358698-Prymnesium_polylepis.1
MRACSSRSDSGSDSGSDSRLGWRFWAASTAPVAEVEPADVAAPTDPLAPARSERMSSSRSVWSGTTPRCATDLESHANGSLVAGAARAATASLTDVSVVGVKSHDSACATRAR